MSYKQILSVLLLILTITAIASCGREAAPSYDTPEMLIEKLYESNVLSVENTYSEPLDSSVAYLFRMDLSDFEKNVERAIVSRRSTDTDGRLLYVLKMKTEDAASLLAEDYYNHYEFPACDNAEKIVILTAGNYALFFKSSKAEAEAVKNAFRRFSGGKLIFEEEIENKG